jgi:hypothetical protein
MNIRSKIKGQHLVLAASLLIAPMQSMAGSDLDAVKSKIDMLEKELASMRVLLEKNVQESARKEEIQVLKKDIASARNEAQEWKQHDSNAHMAGYASVGYQSNTGKDATFAPVQFAPIFHYSYKDFIMLESELEIITQEDGSTTVGMEYLTIDVILNDYMTVLGGKFLSPVGMFRQNLHPGWINKLPSAPSGFGHDQAAPVAEVGLQLRGGLPFGNNQFMNYAAYVGNGPLLEVDDGEIEAVETEGKVSNPEDNFTFGGRLGFLPLPGLEVGLSGICCDAALEGEADRDYNVIGVDASWQWQALNLRGEYVRTKVGALAASIAPDAQEWEAYYVQAAYKILPTKFEAVARYSDYDSTHNSQDQRQWALGLNYLFAPQALAKLAYEFNDGQTGARTDDDSLLLQLSYGF